MPNEWKFENWIAAAWDKTSRGRQHLLGVEEWIFRRQSAYQEVAIAQVPEFGRGLFLDANVQLLQLDEFIYHEHTALPPMLYHQSPHRVLILGGGDGLALREILRDPRVEHVVLVELDELVIQACREHLVALHKGSFDDPRATIIIDDARNYLADKPESFDVVLIDLVDPYGLKGMALYDEVIRQIRAVLAPGAIISTHGESVDPPAYRAFHVYALLARAFTHVALHRAYVASFSAEWSFMLASDHVAFSRIDPQVLQEHAERLAGPLRSLLPEYFPSAFRLPPFMAERLQATLREQGTLRTDYMPESEWIFGR